jgi:hypothetical protein
MTGIAEDRKPIAWKPPVVAGLAIERIQQRHRSKLDDLSKACAAAPATKLSEQLFA